jgi:hypothetical protein
MTDPLAADWDSTTASSLQSYEQFISAFKRNFCSPSKQSIVKCSIYQEKQSRASNMSMSEYFLKFVVLASYLDTRINDEELIDAMKFHYPVYVQNSFAVAPVKISTERE